MRQTIHTLARCGQLRLALASDIRRVRPLEGRLVIAVGDDTRLGASTEDAAAVLTQAGLGVRIEMDGHVERAGGRLDLGHTVSTTGGMGPATHIVHAVVRDPVAGTRVDSALLVRLMRRILDHAALLGADRVALAALVPGRSSTGWEHFGMALAGAAAEHGLVSSSLREVVVCLRPDTPPPSALSRWANRAETTLPVLSLEQLAHTRTPAMARSLRAAHEAGLGVEGLGRLSDAIRAGLDALPDTLRARIRAALDQEAREEELAAALRAGLLSRGGEALSGKALTLVAVHQATLLRGWRRLAESQSPPGDAAEVAGLCRSLSVLTGSSLFSADPARGDSVQEAMRQDWLARAWTFGSPVDDEFLERVSRVAGPPPAAGPEARPDPTPAPAPRRLEAPPDASDPFAPAASEPPAMPPPRLPGLELGRTPVSRLARLLLKELQGEDLDELQSQVRDAGLDEALEEGLVEHVLQSDPSELLGDYFGRAALRRLARERFGAEEAAVGDKTQAIGIILRGLGFRVLTQPTGLTQHLRDLRSLWNRASTSTGGAMAQVPPGAQVIERAAKQLLAFHCRYLFDDAPDLVAHKRGWLPVDRTVERASLGQLFEVLAAMEKELLTGAAGATSERYLALFRDRRLVTRGTHLITRCRNLCAHDRELPPDIPNPVRTFFEEGIAWLEHLESGPARLLPVVVSIHGESVDRWGRRLVEAQDETGRHERLHTDEQLEIGACYFMHPRTKPVRVFPLLVRV